MTRWRRFEAPGAGRTEYREIRQEGIRCFLRWGSVGANGKGSTSTLDDEEHARRHAARKAGEWLRKGFVEVDPPEDDAGPDPEAKVLDVLRAGARPHARPHAPALEYLPVEGFEQVYRHVLAPGRPAGFHEYVVLRDDGRSAVRFAVRSDRSDAAAVSAFLDFVRTRRDLPFDGRSHHKVPLPEPVGAFSHALLCAPALGRGCVAYPAIADRVAAAFPVFDCEIGDADPEVLVDARIHGHGSLPYADWARRPQPVVDLRFDVQPSHYRRTRTFKVFGAADLEALLAALPGADPGSWLEVRSFRGEIRRFTPAEVPSLAEVTAFLHG
ncbi:WGR domain-containing protein [Streptomyces sp. PA03-1a]|nr:WGR domain-containing protein [Streptomyces sp. PA03-1a]MDX2813888.1 WGR domain-containing protein [Streptomyces sp. PA03-5A]